MVDARDEWGQQQIVELSERSDPLGVVSLYATVDPGDPEAAAIDIRNRFHELQQRIAEQASTGHREVRAALETLWPEVERLTSPVESGRGRMVFAGLGDGWIDRFSSQLALPTRVVLDDGVFLHPLLELIDEGRTAGVVLLSHDRVDVLEWRLGRLRRLETVEREIVEASHERAKQIGGGPPGQYHSPVVEQRQARDDERTGRFISEVAARIDELAPERGWERIFLSGETRWTGMLTPQLPSALQRAAVVEPRVLSGLELDALADTVTPLLREEHTRREAALIDEVRSLGLAGNAALGLSEVVAALNEGRVTHLIYDPLVRYVGSVGANGLLLADDEASADGGPTRPEPRLTERIVERALATQAAISPVEGAAEGALAESSGIAALLRW